MFSYLFYLCCSLFVINVNGLPTYTSAIGQGKTVSFEPLDAIIQQTKDFGNLVSRTATSIGTTISDFASEIFQQGVQQTSGFFNAGHDVLFSNLHEAKRFGEEGMAFLDNAVAATGNYISDTFYKLPFVEMRITDNQDTVQLVDHELVDNSDAKQEPRVLP